jgi:glutathione peroxidase
LPKLRAKESIDLCQRFAGKPLVIVNTASFCGFAPQFKGLEALNQRYKGRAWK